MRSRSKALRHQLKHWACERLTDEVGGRTIESLAVEFQTYGAAFRLRLWDDGGFWFSVREMTAHRIVFELSFNGWLQDTQVSELLRAVEASFAPGNIRQSAEDAQDRILKIWAEFDLHDVDRGRR